MADRQKPPIASAIQFWGGPLDGRPIAGAVSETTYGLHLAGGCYRYDTARHTWAWRQHLPPAPPEPREPWTPDVDAEWE